MYIYIYIYISRWNLFRKSKTWWIKDEMEITGRVCMGFRGFEGMEREGFEILDICCGWPMNINSVLDGLEYRRLEFANQLHDDVVHILDDLAPMRRMTKRCGKPFNRRLSSEAVAARRNRRHLERRYRRTHSEAVRQSYSAACPNINRLIRESVASTTSINWRQRMVILFGAGKLSRNCYMLMITQPMPLVARVCVTSSSLFSQIRSRTYRPISETWSLTKHYWRCTPCRNVWDCSTWSSSRRPLESSSIFQEKAPHYTLFLLPFSRVASTRSRHWLPDLRTYLSPRGASRTCSSSAKSGRC